MNELRRDDFTNSGDSTANFVEQSYSNALMEAANRIPEIVCIGVDLSVPTESDKFRDTLSDRFFPVGMAEANAIGIASGMARMGDIPFVHGFGVFLTRRPYDQIAMQVAYPNVNVKMIGFLPGLTSNLGVSHQAIEDIALMRILTNLTVVEPAGPENTKLLKQSCEIDPSRTVKVKPSPAGTVEPVNEKPNTTTSETLTVNPFAAA